MAKPVRRRLPDEREAITHKFSIAGHEGYITVGKFEDGTPGELFITMSKEGSTVSGLMDSFATGISLALQYGVPLKVLVNKFSHSRYEPSGITNNPEVRFAKSITDYIFRWLALKFLPAGERGAAEQAEGLEVAHAAKITGAAACSCPPRPRRSSSRVEGCHFHQREAGKGRVRRPRRTPRLVPNAERSWCATRLAISA